MAGDTEAMNSVAVHELASVACGTASLSAGDRARVDAAAHDLVDRLLAWSEAPDGAAGP